MESYTVVRPEHLNHYGHLFGGCLLKWVDEIAWIAASRDNPGCRFVTIGMDRVEFHRGVHQGAVLRFDAKESCRGRYLAHLFGERLRRRSGHRQRDADLLDLHHLRPARRAGVQDPAARIMRWGDDHVFDALESAPWGRDKAQDLTGRAAYSVLRAPSDGRQAAKAAWSGGGRLAAAAAFSLTMTWTVLAVAASSPRLSRKR